MAQREPSSPAWVAFSTMSFLVAAGMAVLGVACLPLDLWVRGYLAMAFLLLVHSAVSLSKTLRDWHEARVAGQEGAQ